MLRARGLIDGPPPNENGSSRATCASCFRNETLLRLCHWRQHEHGAIALPFLDLDPCKLRLRTADLDSLNDVGKHALHRSQLQLPSALLAAQLDVVITVERG